MRERQLIKDRSGQDFLADLLMAQTEPVTLIITGNGAGHTRCHRWNALASGHPIPLPSDILLSTEAWASSIPPPCTSLPSRHPEQPGLRPSAGL